jgi:membrane protease YdiL (CAAX protease family)
MGGYMAKLLIPIAYFGLRYGGGKYLEDFGQHGPELFDLAFCGLVLLGFFRNRIRLIFTPTKIWALHCLLMLGFGVLVSKWAHSNGIPIPFELSNFTILFMLLLGGPVLEEILFRLTLWLPLQDAFKRRWLVLMISTLFFVSSHGVSYFGVPPEYKIFVIYQLVYVSILGLYLGWVMSKVKTVTLTIILHALFNLGFFLGMVL